MSNLVIVQEEDSVYKFYNEDFSSDKIIFRSSDIDERLKNGEKQEMLDLIEKVLPRSNSQTQSQLFELKNKIQRYQEEEEEIQDYQEDNEQEVVTDKIQSKNQQEQEEEQEQQENEDEQNDEIQNKDENYENENENDDEQNNQIVDDDEEQQQNLDYPNINIDGEELKKYQEALKMRKALDENVIKLKARVQLLKQEQQKNIMKASQIDNNTKKIHIIKESRYYKQTLKEEQQKLRQDEQNRKKEQIAQNKLNHQRKLNEQNSRSGEKNRKKQEEIKKFKEKIKSGYKETLNSIMDENKQLYEKVKNEERRLFEQKRQMIKQKIHHADNNYKGKVKYEMDIASKRQDELDELEIIEKELLQKLKVQYLTVEINILLDHLVNLSKFQSQKFRNEKETLS